MKRRTFEEIIHEEFRWPATGDMPFVEAADHLENANIAVSAHTRLVLMKDGYKKGADIMIAHTLEHGIDRDFLVCPIIFNYRQFLELSLKYMLATYGRHVDVRPNWNSHRLEVLWRDFATMLERFGTEDPDEVSTAEQKPATVAE
jgi:hypothetical protein